MHRALAMTLILLASASSGCIDTERPCPENTCFPLTSSAFNSILEEVAVVAGLELASAFDAVAVPTLTRFT